MYTIPVNSVICQIWFRRQQAARDASSTYHRLSQRVDWPPAVLFQVATPAERQISYSVNNSETDCQTYNSSEIATWCLLQSKLLLLEPFNSH